MEVIQKSNFNQWKETEFERNLCISHASTKSNEFSIGDYIQKNSDISDDDIDNTYALTFRKDEMLRSLGTIKKKINDEDNKITIILPTSIYISSYILDTDFISFNNGIIRTLKTLHHFNLFKSAIFPYNINLKMRLNKKNFMSYIIPIIALYLNPVNAAQRDVNFQRELISFCDPIFTKCNTAIENPIVEKLCKNVTDTCRQYNIKPIFNVFNTEYILIMFFCLFLIFSILVKNNT
ncbi:hypothetical protein PRELSG_0025650 [Plasmodium relictum]|uniref:Uncharacterized protein n=1 Tax=Plasmodium relictum TaxID=85471 RepID=A0A1J1GK54_PLARL|nr:hypothetical protein PRELSG_0025650 [Plasmodium relictum]CRG84703.1 hypothetical protein PRELSG_0025650 [Plasmodium relictum]